MRLHKILPFTFLIFLFTLSFTSIAFSENKVITLGVVPHVYGNPNSDDVEKAMYNYMGQQENITHIITPSTKEDFINKLKQLNRHGYKIKSMVVAGHGTGDFPHIKFGDGTLDSGELDKSTLTKNLNFYKKSIIKYENLLRNDPESADLRKRLTSAKKHFKTINTKLNFINSIPAIMENNGVITLINCSTAASQKGVEFIKNLGAVLFGDKKSGTIIASKSDVTVDQSKSILSTFFTPDGFWGNDVGDYFIDGDWVKISINGSGTLIETLQCPKQYTNSELIIDTNNNPNDNTYTRCVYFNDGALKYQIPYVENSAQKYCKEGLELIYGTALDKSHPINYERNYKDCLKDGPEIIYSWCQTKEQKKSKSTTRYPALKITWEVIKNKEGKKISHKKSSETLPRGCQ